MEAAEPMAKAARAGAPRKTGRLYETIDVAKTLSRRQRQQANRYAADNPTNATVYVGAKPIGPSILLEFGTTRGTGKAARAPDRCRRGPFMRPAFESEKMGTLELLGKADLDPDRQGRRQLARRTAKGPQMIVQAVVDLLKAVPNDRRSVGDRIYPVEAPDAATFRWWW
jgi:hypothetical protein